MESKLTFLVVLATILSVSVATEVSTTPPFVAQVYVPQVRGGQFYSPVRKIVILKFIDFASTSFAARFGR